MRSIIATVIAMGALIAPNTYAEEAPKAHASKCHTKKCHQRVHKKHRRVHKKKYIARYRGFLAHTGACESGTTTNLHRGVKAISPSGQYRGRYQFGMPDWHAAGGKGDPRDSGWLEQAYRAVKWLKINGRQSWPNC